ncbi:Cu(I)-responsive transcriptional regulator [Gilvimarinus sp. SDUM040013]|uniref:HTH-type transcriptional regulator CueR n=1 Tax=Gilvimarinus gilvus TaxID=3058038 RepID=A0ABU4RT93_9GAMM|nr:Cu(I)-responsive transcriptional regulator [Gilvimarinus sp. SDUM040013]MDO3387014.1 Cu(I)-responsive transcriptional regulator [Gilvimarinus sp. SDUM040013]MDX6848092.1 Cu(I)-responsive transcriptional regulator [Gilvimarinus sp. SDUM040013]
MKIGEAARATGLSAKSIRYYESLGLVQSLRRDNGYREYDSAAIQELNLLARARRVGFSLEECRYLVSLLNNQSRHSADVKQQVLQKVAQLDEQLVHLTQMRNTLLELADRCQGDEGPECAILQDLSSANTGMRFTLVEDENG